MFIQDRRQTMRFHCPLGGRTRENDSVNGSLPPLHEPFRSGGNSNSTFNSFQGKTSGSGWRPPPSKAGETKGSAAPRVPTQSQIEVAKRLTQGMSSAPNAFSNKPKTTQNTFTSNGSNYAFQLDREGFDDQGNILTSGGINTASTGGLVSGAYGAVQDNNPLTMHPRISK